MGENTKGFTVALDNDISDEQSERVKAAIMQIRGVVGVQESLVSTDDYINRVRIRTEIGNALYDILYPKRGK